MWVFIGAFDLTGLIELIPLGLGSINVGLPVAGTAAVVDAGVTGMEVGGERSGQRQEDGCGQEGFGMEKLSVRSEREREHGKRLDGELYLADSHAGDRIYTNERTMKDMELGGQRGWHTCHSWVE
jgi:hypothetical protein